MYDVIIIGGGLFGSVMSATLRRDGHKVVIIDNKEPEAGSAPAACLMKPGWFSSMGKENYEPALELLDELYGVQDLPFKVGKFGIEVSQTIHWVRPKSILCEEAVYGSVWHIVDSGTDVKVLYHEMDHTSRVIFAKMIIVAAGIWTDKLVKLGDWKLEGRKGMAFTYKGQLKAQRIVPWAPYRQLIAFNRGRDEAWVGDGTAILPRNWSEDHERASESRGRPYTEGLPEVSRISGIRPYVKGAKPCLVHQSSPRVWAVTGGAKNGTIAAGWAAHYLSKRLS